MKLVEQIFQDEHKNDFRTRYIKYRAGRLKHQYWLWNRKRSNKVIDQYDAKILANCKPGHTAFFCSAGYYLKDIWPEIDSIEMHSIVKEFYQNVILVSNRSELASACKQGYDNFAVVNNRGDHWVDLEGLTQQMLCYTKILNTGARVFYSFRDTQIHYNRLTVNSVELFIEWAKNLTSIDLQLVWHDVVFKTKTQDGSGNYDAMENPDTVNGNIKFWFVYKGNPWTPLI